jgi:GAF domain-containing protein
MLKHGHTLFSPPVFPGDDDKTRKARYSHVIAFALLALVLAFETIVRTFVGYTSVTFFDLILIGVGLICIAGLVLLRKGYVRFTSFLLVILVWLSSNGLAATGYGARDASYLVNFAIVLMAGLLLGWQASLFVTMLSIFSGLALAYAEQNRLIVTTAYPIAAFVRDISFVFALTGVLIFLLISGLENALRKSRMNLAQLASMNASLNNTQSELQQRSAELLAANQQLENRTRKLHAITMVTRATGSIQDFNLLLRSIPMIIGEQLGYYHVGLFLLDERKEFAILRSTNTDGGLQMLSRGYRVPVGQIGPISLVAQTGQPQVVLSMTESSGYLQNPDLPDTQSGLVLPLKSGEQIIGVLDIQSMEPVAFTENDVSILSVLADQVATSIQNLVLYEQSQRALRRADVASVQTSALAWKAYQKAIQTKGYRYDGFKSEPLKEAGPGRNGDRSMSVPIQTIGSFKLNPSDPSRAWTDDEILMVRATAERVALALEGVRLLDEAQKRAAREAFLSEVATKLSASFQLDSIVRDTVQELGETLKNSTVTFQLVNPAELTPAKAENADETFAPPNGSGADHE